MRRREFIVGLGSAAAWPVVARGQREERGRLVGTLDVGSGPSAARFDAFRKGLAELGWTEGRNIRFEKRSAVVATHLPSYAAELARLAPDAIFVSNSTMLTAIRHATSDIQIVFSSVTDPVGQGFVSSLARPGGNITGFASAEFGLSTKLLELLKTLAPNIDHVAYIYDPVQPAAVGKWAETEAAATSFDLRATKVPVHTADEIERAIATFAREPNAGLVIEASVATAVYRELIAKLALLHRLPAMYTFRYFVESGGLASYAPDDLELSRRAASYVDRILTGEKARDLPVQLPTKFEFVINLKTAKAMGLDVPAIVLARADEVIE